MDIDKFGEIVDQYLKDSPIAIIIDMPAGESMPTIKSNTGASTLDLYVLLYALTVAFDAMTADMGGADKVDIPGLADGVADMVREALMEDKED